MSDYLKGVQKTENVGKTKILNLGTEVLILAGTTKTLKSYTPYEGLDELSCAIFSDSDHSYTYKLQGRSIHSTFLLSSETKGSRWSLITRNKLSMIDIQFALQNNDTLDHVYSTEATLWFK